MTALLTHEAFANCLNTTFRIRIDDSTTIEALLIDISEHLLSPQQERFAIVFRAPNEMSLGQGLRRFEHDQMGGFDLFLVPISRDEQGTCYEAVFNRLRKNTGKCKNLSGADPQSPR
jgi:hypothetical protein